jgi:hypothetical protein
MILSRFIPIKNFGARTFLKEFLINATAVRVTLLAVGFREGYGPAM